jgi:ABC-type nitrate/sulfonate/bicarbonate transport system substrate-binding protein
LLKAGLSQESAIFSPIGVGGVQRIAIMQSGTMPAIFLSYLEERVARGQGALANAHVLIDFGSEIQIPYNGLATSSAGLASNPDLTRRFLASIMMGVRYMKHFRAGTLKVLEKYAKGTAPAHIAEAFDETMPTLLESGEAPLEARETDLKIRGAMLGMKAGTGPTVDELYDYTQIRQALAALDASGWQPVE